MHREHCVTEWQTCLHPYHFHTAEPKTLNQYLLWKKQTPIVDIFQGIFGKEGGESETGGLCKTESKHEEIFKEAVWAMNNSVEQNINDDI